MVDMDKSKRLSKKLLEVILEHIDTEDMKIAEIAIALNDVIYHLGNASRIETELAIK